jgi:2-iminobutanoate/2-iminopropanoate deaminase
MKETIQTPKAPQAIGPYSQAVRTHAHQLLFLSGQIPLDPATGEIVPGGIEAQTERVLINLKEILEAGGSSLQNVIKTTVYLKNLQDFPKMNDVYSRYFVQNPPARSTIEVSGLPRNASIEIDAIAEDS